MLEGALVNAAVVELSPRLVARLRNARDSEQLAQPRVQRQPHEVRAEEAALTVVADGTHLLLELAQARLERAELREDLGHAAASNFRAPGVEQARARIKGVERLGYNPALETARMKPTPVPLGLLLTLLGAACARSGGELEPVVPPPGGDLDPAVERLIEEHLAAARKSPGAARSHATLGLVYEANELWPEAAASFELAERLDPHEPLWTLHRATALRSAGDAQGSLALLRQVADELPGLAAAQHRLGDALLAAGAVSEARARFERASTLAPDRPEGLAGLGAAELAAGDARAAASALERALTLDPSYRSAHYLLGLAYRELGRDEEARSELALGVEGRARYLPDPLAGELRRYAVARTTRLQQALLALEAGKPERAAKILEALRQEQPDDVTVLNDLAIALQRTGQLEPAFQLLERAKDLDPGVLSTWINLAALLLDQGMTARALEHAERALALAPDSGKAHLTRARVLLRAGRPEEARAELVQSLRLDPRGTEALALLAHTSLALGRLEEARAHYASLARVAPADPAARVGLADVALRSGDRAQARRELAEARRIAPDHPDVVDLARRLETP